MKPLFVLAGTFILSCLLFYTITHDIHLFLSGRIAMCIMLIFTSIAHFVFYKGMMMMLPQFIPFKKIVVYLTGIMEILAGIFLLIPATQYIAAISLFGFFILLLPANIIAAYKKVDLEKADYRGNGLSYLWFRVPLQALFIAWVWYFAILN
ncbi:DoxX family protein [Mucilaginibacter puniceus]